MPTVYANGNNEQKVFSKKKNLCSWKFRIEKLNDKQTLFVLKHFEFLVIRNIEFSDKGINSYRNGSKRAEYEALTALNGASMQ